MVDFQAVQRERLSPEPLPGFLQDAGSSPPDKRVASRVRDTRAGTLPWQVTVILQVDLLVGEVEAAGVSASRQGAVFREPVARQRVRCGCHLSWAPRPHARLCHSHDSTRCPSPPPGADAP